MRHIFIVGSKGIPSGYGGYETFVDKLTEYHQEHLGLKYHVACKSREKGEYEYHNAHCFQIKVPSFGSAEAIYYDVAALQYCCRYIEKNHIRRPIVYLLACRIGPFLSYFSKKLHALGGTIYLNPDGHEWLRAKWSAPVRKYWKISERLMVKHVDFIICDSKNIEAYIHRAYQKQNTTYIAYGTEIRRSILTDDSPELLTWYEDHGLSSKSYYIMVGRFVPENNFETIIREFMKSKTKRTLAIITTPNKALYKELERKLHFQGDKRIQFVGTVYEKELLMKIRENAFGYFHGHEVGGTNPSLLEALGSTDLNLVLDVGFNKEVCQDTAVYWNKRDGNLAERIDRAEQMSQEEIRSFGRKARKRVKDAYSWDSIAKLYESVFVL